MVVQPVPEEPLRIFCSVSEEACGVRVGSWVQYMLVPSTGNLYCTCTCSPGYYYLVTYYNVVLEG